MIILPHRRKAFSAGGGGFASTTVVDGLLFALDPELGVVTGGAGITSWTDQIGGFVFNVSSTSGLPYTAVGTPTGKPYVMATTSSNYHLRPELGAFYRVSDAGNVPWTQVSLCYNTYGRRGAWWCGKTNMDGWNLDGDTRHMQGRPSGGMHYRLVEWNNSARKTSNNSIGTGWYVICTTFDGAGTFTCYINNVNKTNVNDGIEQGAIGMIGSYDGIDLSPMGPLFMYDHVLSSGDRTQLYDDWTAYYLTV